MPAEVGTGAARLPRRARYLVPRDLPRRGELLAACAVVVVVAHLLFAQFTLLIAALCYLVGKTTRWRTAWLLGPAAAGLVWALVIGPGRAAAGFVAGPAQVIDYLTASGHQAKHLLRFAPAFAGAGSWLPRQLPLALLAGAAEAALAGWLSWLHTDEWTRPASRPGLFVVARKTIVARSIRTGGVVTRDGACLGIAPDSGGRIALSWSEAGHGVLVCGAAAQDVLTTSFQLVQAALCRRKPVVVVDCTVEGVRARLAAACLEAGVPLPVFGGSGRSAVYEPFRYGDPGQRAALVAAMPTWDGPGNQYRRGCTAYLTDVFELLDAVPGDPRVPMLDEVIHLLDPAAIRARAAHVPPGYPRRAVLVERVEVSASLVSAEPATIAVLSRQLRAFRASAAGRWLGQPVGGQLSGIDLDRTVTGRSAALFCLGGSAQAAGPEALAMLVRLVCQDLLRLAASLRVAGGQGDGVIWLAGCQVIPEQTFAELVASGPAAGLAVLATTTSASAACALAECANALAVHRITDPAAARRLAGVLAPRLGTAIEAPAVVSADDLMRLGEDEFLLAVRSPRRLVPRALTVRARR
jgi:hypothetical protein